MPVHLYMPIGSNDRQLLYSPSLALNQESLIAREHSIGALAIWHQPGCMRADKIVSQD